MRRKPQPRDIGEGAMEGQAGFTVWFTGLHRSGKKTLARLVAQALHERGVSRIELLDAAEVRRQIVTGFEFGTEHFDAGTEYLAYLCSVLMRNGVVALVTAVSPERELREFARRMTGRFVEVFVDCPIRTCIERDADGLYEKALNGALKNVVGVTAPYEPPTAPDVVCKTVDEPPEVSVQRVLTGLERLGYVPPAAARGYSAEEEALVRGRLESLGYL